MAIYHEDIVNIELESGTIHRSFLHHAIGYGDENANRFGIRAFRYGQPEELEGTCTGYFIRADGQTVAIIEGVVSGNEAYVTLPEACYAVEGNFTLAIKVSGSNVTGTMRIVDGVVSRTSTGEVVDPGTLVDSIDDLIDAIEAAVASVPAEYDDVWTTFAPNFSSSTAYRKGQYVTYDGELYKFTANHAAGSWSGSDVETVNVGDGLYQLFFDSALTIHSNPTVWTNSNLVAPYNDLNTFPMNEIGVYLGTAAAITSHAPVSSWFTILSYCYDTAGNGVSTVQIATQIGGSDKGATYYRAKTGENTFTDWFRVQTGETVENAIKAKTIHSNPTVWTNDNLTSPYNDLDTFPMNEIGVYLASAAALTSNAPVSAWFTILSYCYDTAGNGVSTVQIATQIGGSDKGAVYMRIKNGENSFTPWGRISTENTFYVSPSGTYDGHIAYTTFKAGVEAAMKVNNSVLRVGYGTYDLVSEFGQTYLDNFEAQSELDWAGCEIGNGIKIIFDENARLVYNYTGNNDDIKTCFSPLNVSGDFTLINADIEVTNARYCVHEDMNTVYNMSPPMKLHGEYIDCKMIHNGSNGTYTASFCIGRGDTGNCVTKIIRGYYHAPNARHIPIFTHNGGRAYNSTLIIDGIRMGDTDDHIRLSTSSANGNTVNVILSNSLLGSAIEYGGGTPGKYVVTEWNNDYIEA